MAIKRFVRHKEKQHLYLTPSIRSKRWEYKRTHTGDTFPLPSPLSLLVLVVAAFAVQSEASVIVVCILYFDKTFIYAKPRQWKHYSHVKSGLRERDGCWSWRQHTINRTRLGDEKGVLNSSALLVAILFLFSICYSKAIAGCLADESRILSSTLANRENER